MSVGSSPASQKKGREGSCFHYKKERKKNVKLKFFSLKAKKKRNVVK